MHSRKKKRLKVSWIWKEWLLTRSARKAVSDRITAVSIRRRESSSDRRLRALFRGKRGPSFDVS